MTEPVRTLSIAQIPPYEGPHAIPGIRFRHAREALGVTAWGMNVLELDAHTDGYPEHDHTADGQEEVYLVLEGSVDLVLGEERRTLGQGDFARVAPEQKRKLVTGDSAATVLALGATPGQAFTPRM